MRERDIAAAQVEEGKESSYLWDDRVTGLGLRVRKTSKTFVYKAKIRGRTRWISIGRYGEITLTDARKIARRHLVSIASGQDPTDQRQKQTTLRDVFEIWEAKEAPRLKPSTRASYARAMRKDVLPGLGTRAINSIRRADIERLHGKISASEPIHANRTLAALSSIWSHAERWGMADPRSNPCTHVKRNKETSRERFLNPKELKRLHAVLDTEDPAWADIIRMILLSGMRKGEVLALRWEDVDWDDALLRLPDSKTGSRVIPLSEPALNLLASRKSVADDSALVFPSDRTGGTRKGIAKWWNGVRARAGLWDVRIHDLRHTMATAALEAGHSLDAVGIVLGHTNIRTTSIYSHVRTDVGRAVANDAASQLHSWQHG